MKYVKMDLNKHNLETVSELIYETDKNLFQTFLHKNQKIAVKKLKKLIIAGGNCYGYENIYIAENENGEVIGILVAFKGDDLKFTDEAIVFWNTLNILDFLKLTFIKPFYDKITATSIESDDFYIGNLAVANGLRGHGIGTNLLKHSIFLAKKKNCKRVVLDVIFENEKAKNLYEGMGFKVCGEKNFKWLDEAEGTYGMEYILNEREV